MPNCGGGSAPSPGMQKRSRGFFPLTLPLPVLLSPTGERSPPGAGATVLCAHRQRCLSQGLKRPPRGSRGEGRAGENVPKEPLLCLSDPQQGPEGSLGQAEGAGGWTLAQDIAASPILRSPHFGGSPARHMAGKERQALGCREDWTPWPISVQLPTNPAVTSEAVLLFRCSPGLSFALFSVEALLSWSGPLGSCSSICVLGSLASTSPKAQLWPGSRGGF